MIEYETRYCLRLPSLRHMWTVGRINALGEWLLESNHTSRKEAEERRDLLNRLQEATRHANPQLRGV